MRIFFLILGLLAAFYAAYIVGWLVYVGYLRWRGRGNNSIAVTEDGHVILERGGFIWRVIRFTYWPGEGWELPRRWDASANLCPIGARFLYGLTIFPLGMFPIIVLILGFCWALDKIFDKTFLPIMKKRRHRREALKEQGGQMKNKASAVMRLLKRTWWPFGKFFNGVGWALSRIDQVLSRKVPAGPELWPGRRLYAKQARGYDFILIAVAWGFVVETVAATIVTIAAMIIGGSWVLWWWELIGLCLWSVILWVLLIGIIDGISLRSIRRRLEKSTVGKFLKAWWAAKHGAFCPPVEFLGDAPPTTGGPTATPV